MALRLKLNPKTLAPLPSLRRFSSSSSSPPPPPPPADSDGGGGGENEDSPPPPSRPYSSSFRDIKERLKSLPPPPFPINPALVAHIEEIRNNLAHLQRPPSSPPTISFQELPKNTVLNKAGDGGAGGAGAAEKGAKVSLDFIKESLRQFRPSPSPSIFKDLLDDLVRLKEADASKKGEGEGESKALKTDFVKMYSFDELGEKLRKLRPEEAMKGNKDLFSLSELYEGLAKLRELEEKETESRMGGAIFKDLRDDLVRLKEADASKKANMQRLSINLGTPTYMLKPPQEHLLERDFHPDHMSSAEKLKLEKLKLELKRVRDEFKMSDSDCGSARVQVAQLTTKIKHLSAVLHETDKRSRKGLQGMVQRMKKLLKHLQRTDWDSYCMVLSRLGIRDAPQYKAPEYKR